MCRCKSRRRFNCAPAFSFESLDFPATERKLNAYYAEFYPVTRSVGQSHQHSGVEFIYLLEGKLALKIKDDEHILESCDSIYFDSGVPHSYRSVPKGRCTALVVTVP